MKNKIIYSLILSLFYVGSYSGQVGIGTSNPEGILDLSTTSQNPLGFVLPRVDDIKQITNPKGGNLAFGTIAYDNTSDCIRLYKENNGYNKPGWSDCSDNKRKLSIIIHSSFDDSVNDLVISELQSNDFFSRNTHSYTISNGLKSKANEVSIPASYQSVVANVDVRCNLFSGNRLAIYYDLEDWTATPDAEYSDIVTYTSNASDYISANCDEIIYGVTLDGLASGLNVSGGACSGTPSVYASSIDWTKVDSVIIQSQRLVDEDCNSGNIATSVETYKEFNLEWARLARAINPKLTIYLALSFRYTSPSTMFLAIDSTKSFVDGYYIAYPSVCTGGFCNVENLRDVIRKIKHE